MGPGYVPRGLALLIMIYGVVMGVRAAFAGRQPFPAVALRPLLLICAAVALFALLLPFAGLALTSVAVVVCAGFAAYDVRLRENAAACASRSRSSRCCCSCTALGLPIRIWPCA